MREANIAALATAIAELVGLIGLGPPLVY